MFSGKILGDRKLLRGLPLVWGDKNNPEETGRFRPWWACSSLGGPYSLTIWRSRGGPDLTPRMLTVAEIRPTGPRELAYMTIAEFQELIRRMYLRKDVARGIEGTFMWLIEEIGELAAALRNGSPAEKASEFADVLAWLATIANVAGVDLTKAVAEKYGQGCPGCKQMVCICPDEGKP